VKNPFAIGGQKLGVATTDGVVADGELAAFTTDEDWSIGKLKPPTLVWTL
jgi:hypothetical protein